MKETFQLPNQLPSLRSRIAVLESIMIPLMVDYLRRHGRSGDAPAPHDTYLSALEGLLELLNHVQELERESGN